MVLDEATSAVDMATDVLIQRSIREEFTDATLVVIAHRLSTIADFDRILVVQEGVAVEFGEPGELVRRKGGVFAGMVGASGEVGRLAEMLGVACAGAGAGGGGGGGWGWGGGGGGRQGNGEGGNKQGNGEGRA